MNVGMTGRFLALLTVFLLPFAAMAAQEGTPSYYVDYTKEGSYNPYDKGYIGQSGQKTVIGQRTYTYQTPVAQQPAIGATGSNGLTGTLTPNGVALAPGQQPNWILEAGYTRRFADFTFETGVNSILEWDDMVMNELGVSVQHNFSLRNFDMFAFGEYRMGRLSHGGLSMDYDLEPYDSAYPEYGIFTISMGDMAGKTDYLRLGIGAWHVWDIAGWKISPSIGYEIFHHDLEMSNHIYPNPGVYLPLMNQFGDYIFGDDKGNYYSVPQGVTAPEGLYQVCMSPEDILIASSDPTTHAPIVVPNGNGTYSLQTQQYDPTWLDLPWGVYPGECVIIGGDGMIEVPGKTHIYDTTWSGLYVGLEIEKQMTFTDKLRFYVQFGMPRYYSEGTWPNRTDWQQNPSFTDEGSTGAYSYLAEMEYNYQISERVQLSLKVDTNYFHVGKIAGKLYVAGYTTYAISDEGQYIFQDSLGNTCDPNIIPNCYPKLETIDAHTEKISDSLKHAKWQSFGLHLGIKYSF